ncbi:MAG: hypothetical protein L3K26_05665 [Candidatus Hydrogenedentes bacterium]|nr:hypothetical protein [Candidatus Hydrogenedentota bacterium]
MDKERQLLKLLLWGLSLLVVTCLVLVVAYLVFTFVALGILEARDDGLHAGLTVAETDRLMGVLFHAQTIDWADIPVIYTPHYTERSGGVIREYQFLGVDALNIVVLYDEEQRSWLSIPIYE